MLGATATIFFAPAAAGQWIQNPDNGHWYRQLEGPISWYDARSIAEDQGAHLVTITSQAEQDFVLSNFGSVTNWIGLLQDPDSSGTDDWEWVTGESVDFVAWDGQLDSGGEDRAVMRALGGGWEDKVGTRTSGLDGTPWHAVIESNVPAPGSTLVMATGCLAIGRRRRAGA